MVVYQDNRELQYHIIIKIKAPGLVYLLFLLSIFRAAIFIFAFVLWTELLIPPAGMWMSKTTTSVSQCCESGLSILCESKGHALWLLSGAAAIRHRRWQQCLWALSSDTLTHSLCCYPVKSSHYIFGYMYRLNNCLAFKVIRMNESPFISPEISRALGL